MTSKYEMQCPGCQMKFEMGGDGKYSREIYIHCLFMCHDYLALKLDRSCGECNIQFMNQEELDLHDEECHLEVVDEKKRKREAKENEAKNVKKKKTSQETKSKKDVEAAKREATSTALVENRCKTCRIQFNSPQDVNCHTRAVHKSIACPECPNYFLTNHKSVKHLRNFFRHKHCKADYLECFPFDDQTIDHTLYFNGTSCKLCHIDTITADAHQRIHFMRHVGHHYSCNHCSYTITNDKDLKSHYASDHPDKKLDMGKPYWVLKKEEL